MTIPRRGLPASEHRVLLSAGDLLVACAAVVAALALWSLTAGFPLQPQFIWAHAYWLMAAPLWAAALTPARHVRVAFSVPQTINGVFRAALALLVVYLAAYFYAPRQALPRLMVLHFLWQSLLLTLAWRLVYIWVFTETSFRRRLLIVGVGRAGRAALDVIRQAGSRHAEVVGFVGETADAAAGSIDGLPVLGGAADLRAMTSRLGASEIVLSLDGQADATLVQALVGCQEDGVDVVRMATIYEQLRERVPVEYLESDWLVTSFVDAVRARDASRLAKRLIDLVGATAGLAILILLFPIVALAIWLDSGRPILFGQARVGQAGRLYRVLKFRTMVSGAEAEGVAQWAAPDDPRVTRAGRWLRRTRVDELPQVINILRGEMSLVGPRPERPEFVTELERRIPFYRTRLLVRPGLTGWAQVNFPYGDSVEDAVVKLEYDLYYIKHRSMLFDALIVARTIGTILRFRGR